MGHGSLHYFIISLMGPCYFYSIFIALVLITMVMVTMVQLMVLGFHLKPVAKVEYLILHYSVNVKVGILKH